MSLRSDHGAVTIVTAGVLVLATFFLAFVIVFAQWMVHKRHLQTQADAAALAGALEFGIPCTDDTTTRIRSKVEEFGGPLNPQVENSQDKVKVLLNSPNYHGQSATDDTPVGSPCDTNTIDVKATETGLTSLMGVVGINPTVNAHARVEFFTASEINGNTPIAVTNSTPRKAWAVFIDEDDGGQVLASTLLDPQTGTSDPTWTNNVAQDVTADARGRIGVRIVLSGKDSTSVPSCTELLVTCYDASDSTRGLALLHIANSISTATKASPQIREASLSGSCADPYFSDPVATCLLGLRARVDFNTATPTAPSFGARLQAVVAGDTYELVLQSDGSWTTATEIPVDPETGALPVELKWAETAGQVSGTDTRSCTTGGNGKNADPFDPGKNPCTGSFGVVQRTFAANAAGSGPISAMSISSPTGGDAHDLRCAASSCTFPLQVTISLNTGGALRPARTATEPPYLLVNPDNNQTQALDCDPAVSTLKDEMAAGCGPFYKRNTGTACPNRPTLWNTAQPPAWTCVAISTGVQPNQVAAGLNQRILGSEKPSVCSNPNRFRTNFGSQYLGDPRRVQLVVTPYGSFSGSGSDTTVPVSDLATFYVTGWSGSGGGFDNPCQTAYPASSPLRDDTRPGSGWVLGHFIKVASDPETTVPGSSPCDSGSLTTCVGVLTR